MGDRTGNESDFKRARSALPHLSDEQVRTVIANREAIEAWCAEQGLVDGARLLPDGAHVFGCLLIRLGLPADAELALAELALADLARRRTGAKVGDVMATFRKGRA